MPTYQFTLYEYQDISQTGSALTQSTVNAPTGATFTINNTAVPITIVVEDDDAIFHDGAADTPGNGTPSVDDGNNQFLAQAVTINGVTYPVGTQVELEFAQQATGGASSPSTVFFIRLGRVDGNNNSGTNVGIAAPQTDPLEVGVTYTLTATSVDLTNTTFDSLVCFTYGTMLETPDGSRLIEELDEGDLLTTFDNGSQAVRWIGTRHISLIDMMANPALRPVKFEPGAIGNSRPLLVSPQHRMLLTDWRAQVYFGEDQILVPAKALVNGKTIRQVMPPEGVTYCHLLCDQHEILIAEGALTESFHPSDDSLNMLTQDQQRELDLLFPELALGSVTRQTAYPVVRVQDAKSLRMSA